jgi:hypothetical protein
MWPVDEKPHKVEIRTSAHAIVEKLIERAMSGDVRAIIEIFERVEGKAVANVETEPPPNKPMDIMEAAHRLAFSELTNKALPAPDTHYS